MPNETRVNLKHLLEDLRDAYACPIEEAIVTELIANALDSGSSRVQLFCHTEAKTFRCVDNGSGMNRIDLRNYHNIAATTKERGAGIGFAGVGAKLALLVAEKIVTESRSKYGAQGAAEWHLGNAFRAPWKFISFSGIIQEGKGTAVTLTLKDGQSKLLNPHFLERTIERHFYPLVTENEALHKVLKIVYKKPVVITVNDQQVTVRGVDGAVRDFVVRLGGNKKVVGAGFVEKAELNESFWRRLLERGRASADPVVSGLFISTYGKVIKGGWEWLGVMPKNPEQLSGVVEIPALAEILTTNKADFLSDSASLKKYYRFRKAIQEAVLPLLREWGAAHEERFFLKPPAELKALSSDIEGAISLLTPEFPELESLVGEHWRRLAAIVGEKRQEKKARKNASVPSLKSATEGAGEIDLGDTDASAEQDQNKQRHDSLTANTAGDKTKRVRDAGIKIQFENFTALHEQKLLGKLVEEIVFINTAHPAWSKAESMHQEHYHILLTVALTLGAYLGSHDTAEFVSEFLRAWSQAREKSGRLL